MPTTKLTLSADKDLIRQAKRFAAENGTSVSAMFAGLLRTMIRARGAQETTGPLTRKATGLIYLSSSEDDERLVEDALAAKYGMRR